MGVVRERKSLCELPLNSESAHNSGFTSQASEEEEDALERPQRQLLRKCSRPNLYINLSITKHTGRRKVHRILNNRFLETLMEEDESDVLFETSKSKFQVIMEEMDDALEFLNSYEAEQQEMMNCSEIAREKCVHNNPYLNIPRKIRAAINSKKNFPYGLLRTIEDNLIKYFEANAMVDYFYYPVSCYERMLVHAAAIYNGYVSETTVRDERRVVRVSSSDGNRISPKVQLLCDYIAEIRGYN